MHLPYSVWIALLAVLVCTSIGIWTQKSSTQNESNTYDSATLSLLGVATGLQAAVILLLVWYEIQN